MPSESTKGKLTVKVAPDAPTGFTWIRLYTDEGASAPRPFVIGKLTEVVESEPNNDPTSAQTIESPSVTINGRLASPGDVDGFAVTMETGQTLVASMLANRQIGSPMDSLLQVATLEGFVLAQVDDEKGLDPQLVFIAPARGTYVVRTFAFPSQPNSTIRFAGSSSYVYRLTLTTSGFADYPYPLAVPRNQPGWVGIIGWNLPDEARTLPVVPSGTSDDVGRVEHPAITNLAEVRLVPYPVLIEREPNDDHHPQPIEVPVSITGRIGSAGDRDAFQFSAKKGETRIFRVESRLLGFPLDPVLLVRDGSGKVVTEMDDPGRGSRGGGDNASRDPVLTFTASQDGEYRVIVRDLNDRGGPRYIYRLDALIPEGDFQLKVASDRFTLAPASRWRLGFPSSGRETSKRRSRLPPPACPPACPPRRRPPNQDRAETPRHLLVVEAARVGPPLRQSRSN